MAPLRIAGLRVEVAATTLSLIALACLLWAVFQTARNLSDNVVAGWVAVILASGSVHLARWTMSGMETVLFAALIALANQQLSRKGKHGLLSSAFFGLSTLTRLPGVLHGAVAFGMALCWPGENQWGKLRRLIVTAFPGDREFLRAPDCAGLYHATGAELVPGKFAVVYVPKAAALLGELQQPQTARQWFERGLALMNDATMAQAALAFERCLELDPDNSAAMTNLAYCYLRLGRTKKAQNIFEEVLKSHPRHFDALYGLALAHTKLDNRSQAIAAWKRYIAEAPRSGWKGRAQEHLAQLLAK